MLYLLKSIEITSWDCNEGFVIRAKSKKRAREIANNEIGCEKSEKKDFWLDKKFSSCEALKSNGSEKIVLTSYKNG